MKELVEEKKIQSVDFDNVVRNSGKEELDINRISQIIISFGKTEGERRILERMKNNPSFIQQIRREYYSNTPREVRTTVDFINWVNDWENRRGNL